MILIDSNIWIAAWRGPVGQLTQHLEALIDCGQCGINPFILTELLQGASSKKHQSQLLHLLEPIPVLDLPPSLWTDSAQFYFELKAKGLTPTTIDCLLATQCVSMKMPIWSLDKIFLKMTKIIPLELHSMN